MDEALIVKGPPSRGWRRSCLLAHLLLALWASPALAQEEARAILDADRVSYNDETGQASAQGDAALTYQGMAIRAERIDYDAATQRVEAMPLPGEQVSLTYQGRTLRGDRLTYDLQSREGTLTGARTQLAVGEGTLFVHGGELDVLPWDMAVERGMVRGRKGRPEDYVARWRDVAVTTCALEHPHYRLEAKRIELIPGRSVVARRPRVYLGQTYLFTSPFDYAVDIQRRALKHSLTPYFQRSSSRGTGVGITGALGWDGGSFSLGLAWADRAGFEWMAEVEQELGR
ncbi:MAG: LPS-assembly protein LptD, partial [Synergistaceae bacterium]|nr:LPS-assembly protein LptD [Synergistaceae bacterium]